MTPAELSVFLSNFIDRQLRLSVMIWGPPGVGKSSIVSEVARAAGLATVDLRLSQLAPTDLRGLPVAEDGLSRWYPPEFLPRDGAGVLFLDEINMAPPAMQGVAQQLILDRRVGAYTVPDGWLIWAAGNRKSDRASVFDMPSALANRFIHLHVEPDLDSFRRWAVEHNVVEQVIAFLAFRPQLLHSIDPRNDSWPSPRSWEMANALFGAGLDLAPAIGEAAASEFRAFASVYDQLPDLDAIAAGNAGDSKFLGEPSTRYATTLGLALRADEPQRVVNAMRWMIDSAEREWVQLFYSDVFAQLRSKNQFGEFARLASGDEQIKVFLADNRDASVT